MVKHGFCVVETTTWGDFDREKWYLHKVTHNHPVWMQEYARENGRFPKMVWKLLFQLDIAGFSVAMLNELVMTTVVTVKKRVSWAWLGDSRAEFFSGTAMLILSEFQEEGTPRIHFDPFCGFFHLGNRSCFSKPTPRRFRARPGARQATALAQPASRRPLGLMADTATTPGWLMSYWILQTKNWGRSQSFYRGIIHSIIPL